MELILCLEYNLRKPVIICTVTKDNIKAFESTAKKYGIDFALKKDAKKYHKGIEYGSARWGTTDDIKPYTDPVFENNIPLTLGECNELSSEYPCHCSLQRTGYEKSLERQLGRFLPADQGDLQSVSWKVHGRTLATLGE